MIEEAQIPRLENASDADEPVGMENNLHAAPLTFAG